MELSWLQQVVGHEGEVASVHVDVSRTDPQGGHTQELHRREVVGQLREAGAPQAAVEAVDRLVGEVTGEGGEQGRHLVVAADGEVLLDLLVGVRPVQDRATWGPVPSLVPLLQALDPSVPHLLVEADKRGADVTVVDALGRQVTTDDVEGGHDVLHKFKGGGWSHRRFQQRVDDSMERNADVVVDHVRRLVDTRHPEVVVITGDPHSAGLIREGLAEHVGDRLREIRAGGRAAGVDEEAEQEEVDDVLREVRLSRMASTVARFEEAQGKGSLGASGLPAVVTAVQRAAVETLLLTGASTTDGDDAPTLWTTPAGDLVGTSPSDITDQGGETAVAAPAVDVLVRTVASQGGAVELVDGADGVLEQGFGAVLRFDVRPEVPGG